MNKKNQNFDYQLKIYILGFFGVGKSSVIERYVENSFSEKDPYLISAETKSMKLIELDNKLVQLLLYECHFPTERFMFPYLNKNFDGVILVYDIYEYHCFEDIKRFITRYEFNNMVLILFGNKCDLGKNIEIEEQIKKLADEYGIKHFEVSAKTGYNINEGFNSLIKDIIAQRNLSGKSNTNNYGLKKDVIINQKYNKCAQ